MKLRRCLIVLTGGVVVALSTMAAPAFASTAVARPASSVALTTVPTAGAHPKGLATMNVVIGGVSLDCFNPGIIYSVSTTGIHIRTAPNGATLASIGKGRWFDSNFYINGAGPYHCITNEDVAGQQWVYGFPNYNAGLTGYVGLDYLYFVKYINN